MLIMNPSSGHAFIVGMVLGVEDRSDALVATIRHHIYDPQSRQASDITTQVYFRNLAEDVASGRPAIPFADRARRMKMHTGSQVGAYCAFRGADMSTAIGYSANYDGITTFKGVNRNGEPTKFCIVMGAVKSLTDRADKNGELYTLAHVYIGKWPMRDVRGNTLYNPDGTVQYEYRYVDVSGRKAMAERFRKVLQKNWEGREQNAAFLCGGDPFCYISQSDGSQREIYSALNFELMGLAKSR